MSLPSTFLRPDHFSKVALTRLSYVDFIRPLDSFTYMYVFSGTLSAQMSD